jgi:hypothetical protein
VTVTLNGYLFKLGGKIRKRWRKRWFILANKKLSYYEYPDDTRCLGIINIRTDVIEVSEHVDNQFHNRHLSQLQQAWIFHIKTKTRIYKLMATKQADMWSWIAALHQSLQHASPQFGKIKCVQAYPTPSPSIPDHVSSVRYESSLKNESARSAPALDGQSLSALDQQFEPVYVDDELDQDALLERIHETEQKLETKEKETLILHNYLVHYYNELKKLKDILADHSINVDESSANSEEEPTGPRWIEEFELDKVELVEANARLRLELRDLQEQLLAEHTERIRLQHELESYQSPFPALISRSYSGVPSPLESEEVRIRVLERTDRRSKPQEPDFIPLSLLDSESCDTCGVDFGVFKKKHVCDGCKNNFCAGCCSNRTQLSATDARCCNNCFKKNIGEISDI